VVTSRVDRGVSECERALAIDRNHAYAHFRLGLAKCVSGRHEETEAHILEALRLSPRDRAAGLWFQVVGAAKLGAGRDEEAISWFRRSIEADPDLPMSPFLMAAALARLGRLEEAHYALGADSDEAGQATHRQRQQDCVVSRCCQLSISFGLVANQQGELHRTGFAERRQDRADAGKAQREGQCNAA
jgi:tetratricopeptide (TPR) repeat protein